ncbi:hypothetical protein FRC09_009655 [Ceratobasidium sp. 395]|nr:hypothetical protein FRC09_009655 [Ceratobasidium sp. 395]
MITHTSWRNGLEGNNNRFSFVGRRVLKAYLLAFLHAHTPITPTPPLTQPPSEPSPDTRISQLPMPSSVLEDDFDEIADKAIDTRALGSMVGNVWELERVMRWAPSRVGESRLSDPGLYKIRGTTVEAVIGGVFFQFGGVAAHRLFHTRLLPHVASLLPTDYRKPAQTACNRLGGPSALVLLAQPATSQHQERAPLVSASG